MRYSSKALKYSNLSHLITRVTQGRAQLDNDWVKFGQFQSWAQIAHECISSFTPLTWLDSSQA